MNCAGYVFIYLTHNLFFIRQSDEVTVIPTEAEESPGLHPILACEVGAPAKSVWIVWGEGGLPEYPQDFSRFVRMVEGGIPHLFNKLY